MTDIYKGHELKPVHTAAQALADGQPGWLFLILILLLIILVYVRVVYGKYLNTIASALFNNHLTNQLIRDESLLLQRASVMLGIMFNIGIALLLYIISIHYNWSFERIGTGFVWFLVLVLIVFAAMVLKFVALKVCGYLFQHTKEVDGYIFNIALVNNLCGIIIIPMIAIMAFSQSLPMNVGIRVALATGILAYLYCLLRGILIGISYPRFSPFYLFLYLCALEIAPLFVLIKLIA